MGTVSLGAFFAMGALLADSQAICAAEGAWWKPYGPDTVERENAFEFTEKPTVKYVGADLYEIAFAVKSFCDATIAVADAQGKVVRHVASGVLGANAPAPFQKNSLKQTVYWDGKDDLEAYVREPGKLRVRVSLGLKPEFHRVIGWHPQNLIGTYRAVAADQEGIYVLSGGNPQLRKYDRDGNYVKTVFPPAADVPIEKFKGLEKLEYEPGKWALHLHVGHDGAPDGLPFHAGFASTVSGSGTYFPGGGVSPQQAALVNGYFTYATMGRKVKSVHLYRMKVADGTSDDVSIAWRPLSRKTGQGLYTADGKLITTGYFQSGEFAESNAHMAVSPDGKWVYISGLVVGRGYAGVYRLDTAGREALGTKPWVGVDGKPGQDNEHFSSPAGIDCDAQGRVYVCDTINNRIQVFSPEAKHLETIRIDFPELVRVHPVTGALYVIHKARRQVRSCVALTKLTGLKDLTPAASFEVADTAEKAANRLLTLDSWSSPPRVWLTRGESQLVILEEQGREFRVLRDFMDDAREVGVPHEPFTKTAGPMAAPKVACDPVREKLYYWNTYRFDLATGRYEGQTSFPHATDDIAFDKHGRVHVHFNPGFYLPGVARMDPDQAKGKDPRSYPEVPYDYGIEKTGRWNQKWLGLLEVKDQPGGKFFQDGIGVNMRGDVAVQSNIYYVPKMEDSVVESFVHQSRGTGEGGGKSYEDFIRRVQELEKRGEHSYFVPRKPGRRLHGGTVWVFDWTGELRQANIVPGAPLINGVGLDEDGAVYFVYSSTRILGGRAFLSGRGRVIGGGQPSFHPHTGTLAKFPAAGGEIVSRQAAIPMDRWPVRPPDTAGSGWGWNTVKENSDWVTGGGGSWAEGAEWLYAGASPIVPLSCSCPNSRFATDWFKRNFVTEAYRHSIGVVDAAGNLVLHIGRYGNADSGRGPDSPVKVGGDEIAMAHVMYAAVTDNYLALSDVANERITVLKLNYYVEETTSIGAR
jgi:sugar lactone lactonase YvrE